MSNEYQDKFASFDGTNDWFSDKSVDSNELGELAQRSEKQKQNKMNPFAAVRKEENYLYVDNDGKKE